MSLRSLLLMAVATALLIAGCTTAPVRQPERAQGEALSLWKQRRAELLTISQFTLSGRVSSGFGLKGDLRWEQKPDNSFDLRMAGPFGVRAVRLSGTPARVEIQADGKTEVTDNPERWVQQRLGWTFPVRGLRWWVLGLPSPHTRARNIDLDPYGRVVALDQDGWHLSYSEYRTSGRYDLPRLLDATNGEVRLRLVADRWEGLP